ncbi:oligosaccharide flippase family protein [Sphingomonas sp. C8-2]|jgi:O-antigen/teichoic acid export membrane protein|nr:oligosaccharide flippase family protein [Sphingomonas sp. C8-2]
MINRLLSLLNYGLKRINSSHFIRNVTVVGGGIAAAQATTFAFTPLLTRLYGPEAFGMAAAFSAIANIAIPLASLGYANAIVMPENSEDAGAVIRLSVLCGIIVIPLSFIAIMILKPWLIIWTKIYIDTWIFYLIPIYLAIYNFLSIANQISIREALYRQKSWSYFVSNFIANIGKLLGGVLAPSGLMLILLTLIGSILNLQMLILRFPNGSGFRMRSWFGLKGVRKAARTHRDFAIYRVPQSLIRACSMGLPVILLASLFGPSSAGQYSVAVAILGAPAMLLGDAVGEVFYPKITRALASQADNAEGLILKAAGFLALAGSVPFGAIGLLGGWIFPGVLGREWLLAGEFSQWVSLWMVAMLATRPVVAAMPALRMQAVLLVYEVVVTIVRIAALYVASPFGSVASVAAYSLVNVIGYIALMAAVLFKVYLSNRNVARAC